MRFRRNPAFDAELKREPGIKIATRRAAGDVKDNAEQIARTFEDTGHYADSFVIEETPDGHAVGNIDIAGHLQEWGSANNPPRAPLRRAARAAGLDLKENR